MRDLPEMILDLLPKRPDVKRGVRVHPRTGSQKIHGIGRTTGALTRCTMDGCGSFRVWVRWPDGDLTKPCFEGMRVNRDGSLTIV